MMEIAEMKHEDIEERLSQIQTELADESADVDALSAEVDALQERDSALKKEAEEKRALMDKVSKASAPVIEERKEIKKMEEMEIRNTKAYIDAYAEYIKSGKDAECRALLSTNATESGTVAVPEFVYDVVKTAWDREEIMSLVRKSYLRGNVKVGFEISGDDAIIHAEGGEEIALENLMLGVVEMKPESIKKAIQISDEVYDLRGEDFLRYIYDELAYKIAKKTAEELLTKINNAPATSSASAVGVPSVTATTIGLGTIAAAISNLSDEATSPVIVMNKLTWGAFKQAQYDGNFEADPFEGLRVIFNNKMPAFATATTGQAYAIVGDFANGALANFPNGEEITFKFDDLTEADADMVRIIGKLYVAMDITSAGKTVVLLPNA